MLNPFASINTVHLLQIVKTALIVFKDHPSPFARRSPETTRWNIYEMLRKVFRGSQQGGKGKRKARTVSEEESEVTDSSDSQSDDYASDEDVSEDSSSDADSDSAAPDPTPSPKAKGNPSERDPRKRPRRQQDSPVLGKKPKARQLNSSWFRSGSPSFYC